MNELELKHLAPYLPYGLSFSVNLNDVRDNFPNELRTLKLAEISIDLALKKGKPILRPLSSITKEEASKLLSKAQGVSVNEDTLRVLNNNNDTIIIQYEYLNDVLLCLSLSYTNRTFIATPYAIYGSHKRITPTPMFIYDWFIENHFDVFGLIDRGLAIEKITLNK